MALHQMAQGAEVCFVEGENLIPQSSCVFGHLRIAERIARRLVVAIRGQDGSGSVVRAERPSDDDAPAQSRRL